jgi:hypothetical protein
VRINVGIASGSEWASVAAALRDKGARSVQDPQPSLPDVLVAEFPEGDVADTVRRVEELPGVRFAERDELRSTLG